MVRAIQRIRREESGFTLTELVTATSLLVIVLIAVLALVDSAIVQAPRDQERAHVVRDAQRGLHRMTRELRQAYQVVGTPTAQSLEVWANILGTNRRVRYRCNQAHPSQAGAYRCVRELLTSAGAVSSTEVIVDRTTSASVFSYTPSASTAKHVEAKVTLPAKGERPNGLAHSIVLSDGLLLRNVQ